MRGRPPTVSGEKQKKNMQDFLQKKERKQAQREKSVSAAVAMLLIPRFVKRGIETGANTHTHTHLQLTAPVSLLLPPRVDFCVFFFSPSVVILALLKAALGSNFA